MRLLILLNVCVSLLLGFALGFSSLANASSKNEIKWYSYDHPPAAFTRGRYKGQGFLDQARDQIIAQLPQYQHQVQEATLARFMYDVSRGQNVCYPALIITEQRQHTITFSDYSLMHYNLQVVLRKSLAEKLKLANEVDLTSLFNQHQLVLARVNTRSYTPMLDKILAQYPQQIMTMTSSSIVQLFHMLIKGRADFLLTYPSVSHFNLSQLNQADEFISLPVKGLTPFILSRVGCTKGAWGDAVIHDINQALAKAKQSPQYFSALTAWLAQGKVSDDYLATYQNILLKD